MSRQSRAEERCDTHVCFHVSKQSSEVQFYSVFISNHGTGPSINKKYNLQLFGVQKKSLSRCLHCSGMGIFFTILLICSILEPQVRSNPGLNSSQHADQWFVLCLAGLAHGPSSPEGLQGSSDAGFCHSQPREEHSGSVLMCS